MSILNNVYKIPQPRGYSRERYYIEDRSETSPEYFDVQDFPLVMGGGRHVIRVRGNGINMRLNSTIDVEIIDSGGQRVFCEVVDFVDRFNNYYITVDIYDITNPGVATAYFVGEAVTDLTGRAVPLSEQGQYNVRWIKQFNILPYERNNAELIFDEPPVITAAQVITPVRLATQTTESAYVYTAITGSGTLFKIKQSNFVGYDRDFASSPDILDTYTRERSIDPLNRALTANRVPTYIRQKDDDVFGGRVISYTNRFGTTLIATSSFFTKEYLGAYFSFHSSESTPKSLQPALPTNIAVSGTIANQLNTYFSSIVDVVNSTTAILNKPISIVTTDGRGIRSAASQYTYKDVSQFTGSIVYIPHDFSYVTSSAVSESYVQLTFQDLKPISGEVYRIRTSTKLQSVTGEYKILNDQIVKPTEYLTDAVFPNGLNYARHISDYRLIGHFATQSIVNHYWFYVLEDQSGFANVSGSRDSATLIDSVKLETSFTESKCFTTQFYQNYTSNQTYTITFNLALDPYTELEVYMNSDVLNSHVVTATHNPRAFEKSENKEKDRYSGDYNRFGKYLGKIVNDRPTTKQYGQVLFDFETDGSGFGRPCFRAKAVDYLNQTASAYISEVSIKPYYMNGFTPNLLQLDIPLSAELVTAAQVSQSIDFKIDYFDYTGKQSEYSTYIDDLVLNLAAEIPSNNCQDDRVYFTYNSAFQATQQVPPPIEKPTN